MSNRLKQDPDSAMQTRRLKRDERNLAEERERDRDEFMHDARRTSRRITTEISQNPTEARELRNARRQIREGKFTTQEELDRPQDDDE